MVHGVKDYWGDKEPTVLSGRHMFIILVILVIFFYFLFMMFFFHPEVKFEAKTLNRNDVDFVSISAVNNGGLKEEYVEIVLNINVHAECDAIVRGDSCDLFTVGRIFCDYLDPEEQVVIECTLPSNGTIYDLNMRSKYETIKMEYRCFPDGCQESDDYLHGSFPVVWNYVLLYPVDRIYDIYMSFRDFLWPLENE